MVRKASYYMGKSLKTTNNNKVLLNGRLGAASPSILKISEQKRFHFYFASKQGCKTDPTAYLRKQKLIDSKWA